MNNSDDNGRFLSECVDFWFDGPGDHTVRPCPPELLEHARAERDLILAEEAAKKQSEDPNPNG